MRAAERVAESSEVEFGVGSLTGNVMDLVTVKDHLLEHCPEKVCERGTSLRAGMEVVVESTRVKLVEQRLSIDMIMVMVGLSLFVIYRLGVY